MKKDYYKEFKRQREERFKKRLEPNQIYQTENELPSERWDTNILERGYLIAHNSVKKIKKLLSVLSILGGLMTKNKGLTKIVASILSAIGIGLSAFGIVTLPDEFFQYLAEGSILFYSAYLAYKGTKEVKESKKTEESK